MRILAAIVGVIIGLGLGAYYLESKYYTWTAFEYHKIRSSIDYKRRASYADMDKATRRPSFQSLVTEHYLSQSTATADRYAHYQNVYYGCLWGAWLYIEKTKYKPTERIKPRVYEMLCIPEEADVYVATREIYKHKFSQFDPESLNAEVLYRVSRIKKKMFYQMYENWFHDRDLRVSP